MLPLLHTANHGVAACCTSHMPATLYWIALCRYRFQMRHIVLRTRRFQGNGTNSFSRSLPSYACPTSSACSRLHHRPSRFPNPTHVLSARAFASHPLNGQAPNSFVSEMVRKATVMEVSKLFVVKYMTRGMFKIFGMATETAL